MSERDIDSRWLKETAAVPRDHWLELDVNLSKSSPDVSSRGLELAAMSLCSEEIRPAWLVTPPLEWRVIPSVLVDMSMVLDPRRLCNAALLLPI